MECPTTPPDPHHRFEPFRAELAAWQGCGSTNYYLDDLLLQSALRTWLGDEQLVLHRERLVRAGADAAGVLDLWARETNRDEHLPRLRRFDGNGVRTEQVEFHPLYHAMGRAIYGSGIMALYGQPGLDVLQLALFYLFVQNGEAGHCCPLACTAGCIKLLTRVGSPELQARYLPRLLDPDYDRHLHASQFLTELQGGSDVGANATLAVPAADGSWRLYGEKWFCSVIDAGLMVLTARPEGVAEGTRGLMTFVAPRELPDGQPNKFEIKRIKYKIGTRSMASAEIDLQGLVAYAVGQPGDGFKHVVDIVLNTSRLYNGFAAAGMARRAWAEARRFAVHRRAFGRPIGEFPLIRRSLALLRTEAARELVSSLHVAHLAGRLAARTATPEEGAAFRFLVNANKYWTAVGCTRAVREAIEVFGGNGTIEEFSVLPRLYRDAIVIESWEGTHNVLCQQVLKDMARYGIHRPVLAHAARRLRAITCAALQPAATELGEALRRCEEQGARLLELEPELAQGSIRPWLDRTMIVLQGCELLAAAHAEQQRGEETGWALLLEHHLAMELRRVDPFDNPALQELERRLAE